MARLDCPRESDVLMMVTTGRWPGRAPEDLRAHVATCEICADLALIAVAIDDANGGAMAPALPSAGAVWWRAQLRSREETAKEVVRPITVAQAVLLGIAGVILGAVFGASAGWFQRGLRRASEMAGSVVASIHMPTLPALTLPDSAIRTYSTALVVAGVAAALATAVVLWALREDRA